MFSAMTHEVTAFQHEINKSPMIASSLDVTYVRVRLDRSTVNLAQGAHAVSLFVTDEADAELLETLSRYNVRLITLRYAGASSIDVEQAHRLGIVVARAPAHSPTSIAEYAIALMMTLIRKIHIANNRVRNHNLSLHGLVGFDLADKTVGIIGTGKVGQTVARILQGFRCKILAYDVIESPQVTNCGGIYVSMTEILAMSDILTLHAPLVPATYHMIGTKTLPRCKHGVYIINTSRGDLVDVTAILDALQTGYVAGLAMDVYEGDRPLYHDRGETVHDWSFEVLKGLPNVLITGHQAALTTNALAAIARSTLHTLLQYHKHENIDYAIAVNESRFPRPRRSRRPSMSSSSSTGSPRSNYSSNSAPPSPPETPYGSTSPSIHRETSNGIPVPPSPTSSLETS